MGGKWAIAERMEFESGASVFGASSQAAASDDSEDESSDDD